MTTLRTAAQQALEALEHGWIEKGDEVVAALKAALKQPQRHVSYVCPQCHWSLEQPEQPYAEQARRVEQETHGRMRIDPVTGNVSISTPTEQPKFTLSCGCPSQYGGVPAYWERDGSTAFGMICEKHWYEYGARNEA